jgi:hypothetical protein
VGGGGVVLVDDKRGEISPPQHRHIYTNTLCFRNSSPEHAPPSSAADLISPNCLPFSVVRHLSSVFRRPYICRPSSVDHCPVHASIVRTLVLRLHGSNVLNTSSPGSPFPLPSIGSITIPRSHLLILPLLNQPLPLPLPLPLPSPQTASPAQSTRSTKTASPTGSSSRRHSRAHLRCQVRKRRLLLSHQVERILRRTQRLATNPPSPTSSYLPAVQTATS